MKASEILKPSLILFVICLVLATLLAGTNALTEAPIAKQSEAKANEARQIVLPDADSFEDANISASENEIYYGMKNGEKIGCTITTSAKGYGGDVKVMVGIDVATGKVTGISILSHSETPGLGANASNESFTSQFKGYPFGKETSESEITAITGATITSVAVTNAVDTALEDYESFVKEGGTG